MNKLLNNETSYSNFIIKHVLLLKRFWFFFHPYVLVVIHLYEGKPKNFVFILHYVLGVVNLLSKYSILYCLILQKAVKWFNISIFNIEEKLLLRLHKEFFKNQNTVPKVLRSKFNS